jgi:phosphoribosylanthranilate isomerase
LIPVRIKVCGLTDVQSALACAEAGADWIGLNFHPASPRSITPGLGAEMSSALYGKARVVGLFVDRPFEELAETILEVGAMDTIQLHGEEDVAYLRRCAKFKPPLKVVRAFRLSDAPAVARMVSYLGEAKAAGCPPHAILVDAHVPGQPGGTGHSIPFDVLAHLPSHPRLILAGGLNPSNVAARVARVRPWMVDVASGVESSPGVKDPRLVSAFVAAARRIPGNDG